MKTPGPQYTPLVDELPRGSRLGGSRLQSAWLADDHLLLIKNNFFEESYRRIAYRDIQAIVIEGSPAGMIAHVMLGVFTLGTLLPALALMVTGDYATGAGLLILGFVLALGWALHAMLGPTCRTHLQTPVQRVGLQVAGRRGVADPIIAALRPRIDSAQADLAFPAAEPEPQPPADASPAAVAP